MKLQLTKPLVVFDLETTGLNTREDRIIELSAVRLNLDGTEDERTWILDPGRPIPPETTEIHGYTDADVRGKPAFAEKADEILAFFGEADLCGFCPDQLDIPCLVEEFARVGKLFNLANRKVIDVRKIYVHYERRDLAAAVKFYLGHEFENAHKAINDTRATLDVFRAQLERYSDLPGSVAAIENLVSPKDPAAIGPKKHFIWKNGELVVNFGQKKGQKLTDLLVNERSYLKWISKGDFPPEVRMVVNRLLAGQGLPPPPAAAAPATAPTVAPRRPADNLGNLPGIASTKLSF